MGAENLSQGSPEKAHAVSLVKGSRENSVQEIVLPVTGLCPDCGIDLSGEISLWAPASWLNRYETDLRLRRGIDRSIVRVVLDRHKRQCVGYGARYNVQKLVAQSA
jgi:hypothetical protein